jgi:uncharacterized GH25 family protein
MSHDKSLKRSLFAYLVVFSVFALGAQTVLAIDVNDISVTVTPSTIKAGEDFRVEIVLRDPDDTASNVDLELEISLDDTVIHLDDSMRVDFAEGVDKTIVINSSDFRVDGDDVWGKNLMAWGCVEDADVNVKISGDISEVSDSDQITIKASSSSKEIDSVSVDPSQLSLDQKVTVTVLDQDNDPLSSADVKFTYIENGDDDGVWDVADKYDTRKTNSDGEAKFTLSSDISKAGKGKYQLDAWKSGYCKVTNDYTIQNTLNISEPEPASPKVGEQFKVKVTTPSGVAARGLVVSISPGNVKQQVLTDGYAPFTLTAPGTYTITVGGGTTGYDEVMKTVKVSSKDQLTVTVSPDPQSVNKQVVITVQTNGKPVDGATVKVTQPGATEQTLSGTTSNAGTIFYTPQVSGEYVVRVQKQAYDDASDTFTARNSFQIELPPTADLRKGSQVQVTVKDNSGNPVGGATVSLTGTAVGGVTDQSGHFSFALEDVGSYGIVVKKDGFIDGTATLTTSGQLALKVDRAEITLGESVKISAADSAGKPIEAQVKITGPESDTQNGAEITYTPKKAGTYSIDASRASYAPATQALKVNPRPLTLTYYFKDSLLMLNASSQGKPVSGLNMAVKTANGTLSATTDATGMASVPATATGEYSITVNSQDYSSGPVTAVKTATSALSDMWVPVLIALVGIVLIGIFAVVLMSLLHRRGRGAKPSFKRTTGSRLNR